MDELKKPYAIINFDSSTGKLKRPTFLLKTRTGHTIGKLKYTNLNMSLIGKGVDEISFDVHKITDGEECSFWDKIQDLATVEFVEYDHSQFEAEVRTQDEDETIKSFTLKSLECELGQKRLYEFHVNDEDAIIYSTEDEFIPTVLCNKSDTAHSLIHRALKDKAPHWSVGYVSPYFNINGQVYACNNIQREFTVDGTSIYDFFDGDVSEEFCCVFTYNTKDRLVNCHNLESCVFLKSTMKAQDGYTYVDGIFYDSQGNEVDNNLYGWCDGLGEDTNIILSKAKLSRSFTRESDAGGIKNCFRVTGGDDIITNTVGAANVTGNNYIYMFGNFQYEDMGEELTNLIKGYQTFYETEQAKFIKNGGVYVYQPDYIYDSTYDVCKDNNGHILPDAKHIGNKVYIVDPCAYYENGICYSKDDVQLSSTEGYYEVPGMYTDYCHTLDRLAYLEHNKFPNVDVLSKTTASEQKRIITGYFASNSVLVMYGYDPSTDSDFRSITSTVETMLKLECDPRYTISIIEDRDNITTCTKVSENTQGTWTGTIRIVKDTDEKDKVSDFRLSVNIKYVNSSDNLNYCKQKMLIALNKLNLTELGFTKTSTSSSDLGTITIISDNELRTLLNQYNLSTLKTFKDGFSSCRSTLDSLYSNLEIDAYKRDSNGSIIKDANGNPIETDIISNSLIFSRDGYTRRYQIACDIYDIRQRQVDEWTSLEQSQNSALTEYKKSMSLKYYFVYHSLPSDVQSGVKFVGEGNPKSEIKGENEIYPNIHEGDLYLDVNSGFVYKVDNIFIYGRIGGITTTEIAWEVYYISSGYQHWIDYNKYIREDEYNNGNYISDGLSDSEILTKAKELLDVANTELSKACNIQYTITGNLNNIFAVDELQKLHSKFALFNYVRAKVDDKIYKLRLIEIRFNESNPDQLDVVFSEQIQDVSGKLNDTASILAQSQSMSTTYSSTTKQAKQGVTAYNTFDNIRAEGMDSSLYLIKNSSEEIMTFERNGLLGRAMLDEGIYSDEQSIFTSNGVYLTRNGFESIETAIGKFKYNGEWVYGINAEYVIGKFIVGENVFISNSSGSVSITGDGINITSGYLYIKGNYGSVEINPKLLTYSGQSGKIFSIRDSSNGRIFDIDTTGKGYYSGSIEVGATPGVNTKGFYVGADGELKASSATIYGKIYATDGIFSGNLNAAGGTFSGSIMGSSLQFKSGDTIIGQIRSANIKDDNNETYSGISIDNYSTSSLRAAVFSFKEDSGYYYYMGTFKKNGSAFNYLGANTYLNGKLYFSANNDYLNTFEGGGIYASTALSSDKMYPGSGASHGDYVLDVNGKSYFGNYVYFNSSYYLSAYNVGGSKVGIYTNGMLAVEGIITSNNGKYVPYSDNISRLLHQTDGQGLGYIQFDFYSGGNLYSIGCYGNVSDTKLKKNILPTSETAIDKIKEIDFIQYDWKTNDDHVKLGVSANQLEEIIPESVSDVKQPEESEYDTIKNINSTVVLNYALKAIQEQQEIIEQLQQQIKELQESR